MTPPLRPAPLVLLHIAPGIPLTAVFAVTAPLLWAAGLPPVWGLLAGVLVVQVPLLEILRGRMLRHGTARVTPRVSSRSRLLVGALTAVACLLLPGTVSWLEPTLRATVFGWLPSWWSLSPLGADTPIEAFVTVVLWFTAAVVAGPIVEERYFRGVLQPRIGGGAWTSALVGAALFAAYHLWQPWAALTVFAFAVPLAAARAIWRLGIVGCCIVHCSANAVLCIALANGLLTR